MSVIDQVKAEFTQRREYLVYDQAAKAHETEGLNASLAGDQLTAREHYDAALDALPYDNTADDAAQEGSILRNRGFTFVREGVKGNTAAFKAARELIVAAIGATIEYAGYESSPNFNQIGPHNTYKKSRRELFSEHAASLGLLARAATAEAVVIGESEQTEQDRLRYEAAHDFARIGQNGYFRVSNAMNGARDERIKGVRRLPQVAAWVARAAFGIAWSVKNDRGSVVPAARTFGGRIGDLKSAETARASVLERP